MKAVEIANKALAAIRDEGELVWPSIPTNEGDPEFTQAVAYWITLKLLTTNQEMNLDDYKHCD